LAGLLALVGAGRALPSPRVAALDQCADQYVLALSPRADIVQLSERALNADSYLRDRARGLPRGRADIESLLASRPTVVVRWWGGDPRLLAALGRRGVTVVALEEAHDFQGVRRNMRLVASSLNQADAGERLVADMDRRLAAASGAWHGRRALYLTSGGATTGRGTLVDAVMQAAGMTNAEAGEGFHAISLEGLVAHPPEVVVQGFFDPAGAASSRWSFGRHGLLRRIIADRPHVSLPSAILACPAWFAADGAEILARAAKSQS